MKHLILLALVLALSSPAWADPAGTDADGCYTDRKWRRHCPGSADQAAGAVKPAKAKAKEKTLDTYKDMKQSKAKAKEKTLDTYKDMKEAKAGAADVETPTKTK